MLQHVTSKKYVGPVTALEHAIKFRKADGENEEAHRLWAVANDAKRDRERLRSAAEELRHRADRILEQLKIEEEGGYACINSSGEIQGLASFVDVECALFVERRKGYERVANEALPNLYVRT